MGWYVSLMQNNSLMSNLVYPTVQDIFKELENPRRDPRGEFKPLYFAEGVEEITDLKIWMILGRNSD